MPAASPVSFYALPGLPLIEPGDDLAALIGSNLRENGLGLVNDDIVVVAQKVVSKSEGLYVSLDDVTPSERARAIAERTGAAPTLVRCGLLAAQLSGTDRQRRELAAAAAADARALGMRGVEAAALALA